jgi:hypothetical protein
VSTKCITKESTPIEFFIADAITSTLLKAWVQYHSPESSKANAENVFVFPQCGAGGRMDFTKPFDYADHKRAAQLCAHVLGLPISQEFFQQLGANAVRRGNAAKVGMEMRGVIYIFITSYIFLYIPKCSYNILCQY